MEEMLGGNGEAVLIQARGLGLKGVRTSAYHDVDLDLVGSAAHAVCAEHRSGKTELLLTLAGRMRPTTGSCVVDGVDATTLRGLARIRGFAQMGIFEGLNEVPNALTVRSVASAELGLAGKRSGRKASEAFLAEWGLADLAEKTIEELNRYGYDLLGIALALCHEPRVLVVQDIEANLTEHQSHKLVELLRRLARERGVTVVCGVTDYDLAAAFDSVVCISDGARAQRAAWQRKHPEGEVA